MADDRDLEVRFDRTNDNWQTGEPWSGRVQGLWLQPCSLCIADWGLCRRARLSASCSAQHPLEVPKKGRPVSAPRL